MGGISTGVAIGAVLAALIGGGTGWVARGLIADHIEIPRIIEQQADLCEAATEKVAAEAIAAEQLRQFKIGEAATQRFIEGSLQAADDAQAQRDLLEVEIENYAQRVRENGSICVLDAAALELIGVRQADQPHSPGGR